MVEHRPRGDVVKRNVLHWIALAATVVLFVAAVVCDAGWMWLLLAVVAIGLADDVDRSREDSPPSDWGWP